MPKSVILSSPERIAHYVAESLQKETDMARERNKALHVCLSGGSTPKLLFKLLADEYARLIAWERLQFWWGDERCVPPDHPESNFGVARDLLLSKVEIPKANIHHIKGEANPEEEAERYKQEIFRHLGSDSHALPVFDWVMLGIGEDGHTASLFPSMLPLDFSAVAVVAEHPQSGQKRVSLGAGVLRAAQRVSILATGASKAGIIEKIFKYEPEAETFPIYHVTRDSNNTEWVMDNEAAAGIL